jgi:hypothetical protein
MFFIKLLMKENTELVASLIFAANSISFVAILLVIAAYIKYPTLKVTEFKYIIFICLCDLIWSIIMIIACIMDYYEIPLSSAGCQL